MKLPGEYEDKKLGPEYLELVTDLKTIINYGKYSGQVINKDPDWEGVEGETLYRYQAVGTGFYYYQYFWVNSGWSYLRWLGSSNVLVVDNSSLTYDQVNPTSNIGRVYINYYTGDGNATQNITGVGFRPKLIIITPAAAKGLWHKTDNMSTSYAHYQDSNVSVYEVDQVTIGGDGFTVGDGTGGSGENPNEGSISFAYTCFG